MTPPSSSCPRLLLIVSGIAAVVAIVSYLVIDHTAEPHRQTPATTADTTSQTTHEARQDNSPAVTQSPALSGASSAVTPAPANISQPATPIARTPEGRIDPASVREFTPVPFPGGRPAYDGEPVTAYIAVPSTGRKVALTVNQLGEYPRVQTAVGEKVEVRLAFTKTNPGTPVAIAAQDGGKLHIGKLSAALPLDDARQLAFAFTVSPNIGNHRVTVTTPSGEVKTLEFWAGPPPVLMQVTK